MSNIKERPPYQQRVLKEREELFTKWDALRAYINGAQFSAVEPAQQALLRAQLRAMGDYLAILDRRIAIF